MIVPVVLSFDVEEHDRIEAAVGLSVSSELKHTYAERMEVVTRRLLDQLATAGDVKATFYIVGQIGETRPRLVRAIADAGHEIGSHSYDHVRIHRHTPKSFAEDLRRSVGALEQAAGVPVVGFRAPTFSLTRQTAWAADVLLASGLRYDSSLFPVRHDRYGVPDAPRVPFWLTAAGGRILELPPLSYRLLGLNLPVAGGGYFRLFPPKVMAAGIRQMDGDPAALAMLYFHPWEFDPDQPKLPLGPLSRWRTYVGIGNSVARLGALLDRYRGRFRRAIDVVEELERAPDRLPTYCFHGNEKIPAERTQPVGR